MNFKNIFSVIAIFAATLVSNPAAAQTDKDLELLENKGYDQLASLKQTERLGNTYNRYLKRTDKETGEVQRWLLSSKPLTGLAITLTAEGYVYDKTFTPLPMVGLAWVASHFLVEGEAGLGRSVYKDPQSDKFGEDYYSVVARADVLWKAYRSSAAGQMLEKWYFALGPGIEYNNRRNSIAEESRTAQSLTVTQDKVQGSSYGIFGKVELGYNIPQYGLTIAVNGHFGVGRDYRVDGTIDCTRYGGGIKFRWVPSKTTYTKLGLLQKTNPEKFKAVLSAY